MALSRFWKSKRVFLTGHTGFKGSWLTLWLERLGAEVVGYSLPAPTSPNLFGLARVARGISSVRGDVRDFGRLKKTVSEHRPEIVIHMAAQSLVLRGYRDPLRTYETNVMGTANLLEAVRQVGGVRVVLNVTSDKCYENRPGAGGHREDDPMGGYDPYSSSKGCAELVTSAFRRSYFNPADFRRHGVALASARAGNVIGGGDWAADRLIPDIACSLIARKTALIRNLRALRPWQHVLEPLGGYLLLIERLWKEGPKFAGGWNFGPDKRDMKPVSWIADRMVRLWGGRSGWRLDRGPHPHEAPSLRLDCSKAKAGLGWIPRTDLGLALEWVVEWYKSYARCGDMRRLTSDQIERFESMASA